MVAAPPLGDTGTLNIFELGSYETEATAPTGASTGASFPTESADRSAAFPVDGLGAQAAPNKHTASIRSGAMGPREDYSALGLKAHLEADSTEPVRLG